MPASRLIAWALALLTACAAAHEVLRIDYHVWSRHRTNWPPADLRAIQALDVLIFFRTDNPDETGRVSFPPEAIAHLQSLKAVANPKTRILLGVFDIGSLVGSPERLAGFVASVRELSAAHGFAGLDIDWEDASVSTADYVAVVGAISQELRGPNFLVTNSVGTAPHYVAKSRAVKDAIDWTHIQFYYSTLNSWSVEQMAASLGRFVAAGVPAAKIAIGLPLYGMQDMSNYSAGPSSIGYRQMIEAGADPAANLWTNPANGHTYHYSGVPLIRDKVAHAVDGGYRGVFTWEPTLDTDYRSETSILRAIDRKLGGEESTNDAAELLMQQSDNLSSWVPIERRFLTAAEAALEYRLRIGEISSVNLQDPGFESQPAGTRLRDHRCRRRQIHHRHRSGNRGGRRGRGSDRHPPQQERASSGGRILAGRPHRAAGGQGSTDQNTGTRKACVDHRNQRGQRELVVRRAAVGSCPSRFGVLPPVH